MSIRKALSFTVLLISSACAQPFTSVPASQVKDEQNVVYYSLPRTTVIVTADITSVERKAPPCAALIEVARKSEDNEDANADKLAQLFEDAKLDVKALPFKTSTVFGHSNFALATAAVPDSKHVYAVVLEGKLGHRRELLLETGLDGLLINGSNNTENRGGDIAVTVVVETFAAVAKIVGSFFGAAAEDELLAYVKNIRTPPGGASSSICYDALLKMSALEQEQKALEQDREKLLDKPTANLPERLLLLESAQKSVKAQRDALVQLFQAEQKTARKGKIRCDIEPADQEPTAVERKPHGLWSLQPDGGIQLHDTKNCSIAAEFQLVGSAKSAKKVTLEISTDNHENDYAATVGAKELPKGDTIIYYRVPGRAKLSLLEDGQPLILPSVEPIAQFGSVRAVAVPDKANKVDLKFKLHPTTGALILLDLKVGRDDAKLPDIGKIGDASSTVAEVAKPASYDSEVRRKLLEACEAALELGEVSPACDAL